MKKRGSAAEETKALSPEEIFLKLELEAKGFHYNYIFSKRRRQEGILRGSKKNHKNETFCPGGSGQRVRLGNKRPRFDPRQSKH
jgi:hypothetical protein